LLVTVVLSAQVGATLHFLTLLLLVVVVVVLVVLVLVKEMAVGAAGLLVPG
jgi:hypothetical protein